MILLDLRDVIGAGKPHEEELAFVCQFFGQDFGRRDLESELKVLRTLYIEKSDVNEKPSIPLLKKVLLSLSSTQRMLIDTAYRAFQLLLVMPATNSTSERSFSALRRIKTYLRSTMCQSRLNHLAILHYHQDVTDKLDIKEIANDFIAARETRMSVFAKF